MKGKDDSMHLGRKGLFLQSTAKNMTKYTNKDLCLIGQELLCLLILSWEQDVVSQIVKSPNSQVDQWIKNLPATQDWIPGSGRSSGEENGNPLQYFCLGNPVDRRAWQATVHRVTKELDTTW